MDKETLKNNAKIIAGNDSYPPNACAVAKDYLSLLSEHKAMEQALKRADIFYSDVLPQLGVVVLQDYANMNELGIALDALLKKD